MTVELDVSSAQTVLRYLLGIRERSVRNGGADFPPEVRAAMRDLAALVVSTKTKVSSARSSGFAGLTMESAMTARAVARLAGTTEQAVTKAARSGRLAGWRPDGERGPWLFRRADASRWVEERMGRRVSRAALAKAEADIGALRAAVAELDAQLAPLEARRDEAQRALENATEGARLAEARGDSIAQFVAQETIAAMTAILAEVQPQIQNLNACRNALFVPLDERDRVRREVETLRRDIALIEELSALLDMLDKAVAGAQAWDDARRATADTWYVMRRPRLVEDLLSLPRGVAYANAQQTIASLPHLRRQLREAEARLVNLTTVDTEVAG